MTERNEKWGKRREWGKEEIGRDRIGVCRWRRGNESITAKKEGEMKEEAEESAQEETEEGICRRDLGKIMWKGEGKGGKKEKQERRKN
jgi:hypothetical protein